VVRISSNGVQLWNRTIRNLDGLNKLFSACKTEDAVYLVGLHKSAGNDNSSVWITKIGLDGCVFSNSGFGFRSG